MNTLNLNLYDTLRKELKLNEDQGRAISQAIQEMSEVDKDNLATKDLVKSEILITREFIRAEIIDAKKEISDGKWDVIRVVLGVFIVLVSLIVGLYIKK